jgi:hypothetical protein
VFTELLSGKGQIKSVTIRFEKENRYRKIVRDQNKIQNVASQTLMGRKICDRLNYQRKYSNTLAFKESKSHVPVADDAVP